MTNFIANGPLLISSRAAVVAPIVKSTDDDDINHLVTVFLPLFFLHVHVCHCFSLPLSLFIL